MPRSVNSYVENNATHLFVMLLSLSLGVNEPLKGKFKKVK